MTTGTEARRLDRAWSRVSKTRGPALLRLLGVAIACVATTAARDAHATPTSRLVYVRGPGAESCPDEPAMRTAVAARLGYDPFRVVAQTTLTTQLSRENGVFRGLVKLVDDSGMERGARTLESRAEDCSELTQALALSMSIAIDPLSVLAPPKPPEPAEPVEPEPPPHAPPATLPAAAARPMPAGYERRRGERGERVDAPPVPKTSEGPRFGLAGSGHAAVGLGPAPAFGLSLSFELAWAKASLGLGARLDFPASKPSEQGGRVRATFVGAELVPCLRVPFTSEAPREPGEAARAGLAGRGVAVAGCGLVLLGGVSAESLDVTAPRASGTFFAGAGLRLGLDVPLFAELSARFGADLVGHFTPYGLSVNGATVFSSSPFSGRFGLGLVRFF